MTDCPAISATDGLVCTRAANHIGNHADGDVLWTDVFGDKPTVCLAVTDEPGPLPSRCHLGRGHDGVHESREHRKLCGRITDHDPHPWTGHDLGGFDREGFLRRVEFACPGHVVVEGGSVRNMTRKEG